MRSMRTPKVISTRMAQAWRGMNDYRHFRYGRATRVLSNPRGYTFPYDNPAFDPQLVVVI